MTGLNLEKKAVHLRVVLKGKYFSDAVSSVTTACDEKGCGWRITQYLTAYSLDLANLLRMTTWSVYFLTPPPLVKDFVFCFTVRFLSTSEEKKKRVKTSVENAIQVTQI